MEEIKEALENLQNLNTEKEQLEGLKNDLTGKKKEVSELKEKAQLYQMSSIKREMANEELNKAQEEFNKIQENEKQKVEELNEQFKNNKENLLSKIDNEMAKYKRKSELEHLKSQKSAYEKIAKNAEGTVTRLTNDLIKGEKIDQEMLINAKEEMKINKENADKVGKELEGYIEIEENMEEYSDLEYLKIRTQGMQVYDLNEKMEEEFYNKYFKETKEVDTNDLKESIKKRIEESKARREQGGFRKMDETAKEMAAEKTEGEKTVEEKAVEEKAVEEKAVEEKAVEEKAVEEKAVEEKTVGEKTVGEKTVGENLNFDIKISAKDNKVYMNGEPLDKFHIGNILEDKKQFFKRNSDLIGKALKTKNIKNIIKKNIIKRKLDPVILAVMEKYDKSKMIDYINSIDKRDINNTMVNITYDLKESNFDATVDKQMQKYARYANKVNGIKVEGLKTRGPKAWFKAFMNKVNQRKITSAENNMDKNEILAYTVLGEELGDSGDNMKFELRYDEVQIDTFYNSYIHGENNKDFDKEYFLEQAQGQLNKNEYNSLMKKINGENEKIHNDLNNPKKENTKEENENKQPTR